MAFDREVNGVGGACGCGDESAGIGNQDCLLSEFFERNKRKDWGANPIKVIYSSKRLN